MGSREFDQTLVQIARDDTVRVVVLTGAAGTFCAGGDVDLKEFFQIGQVVPPGHPLKPLYPDNVEVLEMPDMPRLGRELYQGFEQAGGHLLRAIAGYLNLPEDYFQKQITDGNSILRSIHYPPITQEPESAIRAEQHEDIN